MTEKLIYTNENFDVALGKLIGIMRDDHPNNTPPLTQDNFKSILDNTDTVPDILPDPAMTEIKPFIGHKDSENLYNKGIAIGLIHSKLTFRIDWDDSKHLHINIILENGETIALITNSSQRCAAPNDLWALDTEVRSSFPKYKYWLKLTAWCILHNLHPNLRFSSFCPKISAKKQMKEQIQLFYKELVRNPQTANKINMASAFFRCKIFRQHVVSLVACHLSRFELIAETGSIDSDSEDEFHTELTV